MVERFASVPSPLTALLLEHFHGAVTRIGVTDTAVPHRAEGWNLLIPAPSGWIPRRRTRTSRGRARPTARSARISTRAAGSTISATTRAATRCRPPTGRTMQRLLERRSGATTRRTSSTTTTTSTRTSVPLHGGCSSTSPALTTSAGCASRRSPVTACQRCARWRPTSATAGPRSRDATSCQPMRPRAGCSGVS